MHLSTAQALILVIAVGCAYVVYNAYREANQPPAPLTLVSVAPEPGPTQMRYAAQVQEWQASMAKRQMTVTWPYLGQNNVARVDLPDRVPVTLAEWSAEQQAKAAAAAYHGFTGVRVKARVANPGACIVHVYSATGEAVAQASASGVVTSAEQSLGG